MAFPIAQVEDSDCLLNVQPRSLAALGLGQNICVMPFVTSFVLGIVGAVVGGYIFAAFGHTGVTGFNLSSMVVAIIGAAIVLWVYHAVTGRLR